MAGAGQVTLRTDMNHGSCVSHAKPRDSVRCRNTRHTAGGGKPRLAAISRTWPNRSRDQTTPASHVKLLQVPEKQFPCFWFSITRHKSEKKMVSPTEDEKDELLLSCRYGDLEDIQQFVKQFGQDAVAEVRDDNGNTVLHMAAGNGHEGESSLQEEYL